MSELSNFRTDLHIGNRLRISRPWYGVSEDFVRGIATGMLVAAASLGKKIRHVDIYRIDPHGNNPSFITQFK